MAAVTVLRVIFELKKIRSATVSTFPLSICHEVMGPDATILVFWMLSSKPAFHSPLSFSSRGSLFPLHFLPLEWYHLHTWGCCYFSRQSWFPACDSSSLASHLMYSAQKLNKQGDDIQPWSTTFPIWNQSIAPCPVLAIASWLAYRFLRWQVR